MEPVPDYYHPYPALENPEADAAVAKLRQLLVHNRWIDFHEHVSAIEQFLQQIPAVCFEVARGYTWYGRTDLAWTTLADFGIKQYLSTPDIAHCELGALAVLLKANLHARMQFSYNELVDACTLIEDIYFPEMSM